MNWIRAISLLFVLMGSPVFALQPETQTLAWRNYTLAIPAGWAIKQSSETEFALTRGAGGRTSALIIGTTQLRSSDARTAAIQLAQSAGGPNALSSENTRTALLTDGTPVTYGFGSATINGGSIQVFPVIVQSTAPFGVLLVSFLSNDAQIQREFGELLSSFKSNNPALQGNNSSPSLAGFYARIGPTVVINPLSGAAPRIGVIEMQILPTGQFVLAAPHETANLQKYCNSKRTDCGRYQIRDGLFSRLRPRTAFEERFGLVGEDMRETFRASGSGHIQLGEARWSKIASQKGSPLNGDYIGTRGGSANTSANGSTTSVLTETTYRFRPDGRVWKGGYSAFTSNSGDAFPDSRISTTSSGPIRLKSGSYAFDEHSINFVWEDGKRESLSGYVLENVLIIDGQSFTVRAK